MPGRLRQNTAVTITIGQFIDWADSKTPLYLALGSNDNFDPTKLTCTLTKGSSQSVLTLTKTGGNNNINLLADSQVSFVLTAGNVDTCGRLVLSFNNTMQGSEVILEGKVFEFEVIPANVYDSMFADDKLQVDVAQVAGTGVAGVNDFKADVSGLSTTVKVQEAINAIAALNNLSVSQITSALAGIATTTGIQSILTAISALNNLSSSQITTALSGVATAIEVQAVLTAIAALNNLSESQVSALLMGLATSTEIAALNNLSESQITTLLSGLATSIEITAVLEAISAIEGGATAEEVVDALMASSNFTEGGVLEFSTLLKNLAAGIEGTWNIKAGTTDTWQVSDADSKDVPVLEVQLKENANPYKAVTRL